MKKFIPAVTNNVQVQNISKVALQWAEQYIQEQLRPNREND